MIRVDTRKTFALAMHEAVQLVRRQGGEIDSRLVSEEDIEFIFKFVATDEEIELVFGDRVDVATIGTSVAYTRMVHLTDYGGKMPADVLRRFPAWRRAHEDEA